MRDRWGEISLQKGRPGCINSVVTNKTHRSVDDGGEV